VSAQSSFSFSQRCENCLRRVPSLSPKGVRTVCAACLPPSPKGVRTVCATCLPVYQQWGIPGVHASLCTNSGVYPAVCLPMYREVYTRVCLPMYRRVYIPRYASLLRFVGGVYLPVCLPICLPTVPYRMLHRHATLLTVLKGRKGSREPFFPFHCWSRVNTSRTPVSLLGFLLSDTRFTVGVLPPRPVSLLVFASQDREKGSRKASFCLSGP